MIENQTYNEVGELDDPNSKMQYPVVRRTTMITSTKGASVRYSSPPTTSALPCDENKTPIAGLQAYEEVIVKKDNEQCAVYENATGQCNTSPSPSAMSVNDGYEDHSPATTDVQPGPSAREVPGPRVRGVPTAASNNQQLVINTKAVSHQQTSQGYIDVDYSSNDTTGSKSPINSDVKNILVVKCHHGVQDAQKSTVTPLEQDDEGMPTTGDAHPAYLTLTPGQLPYAEGASPPVLSQENSQNGLPSNAFPAAGYNGTFADGSRHEARCSLERGVGIPKEKRPGKVVIPMTSSSDNLRRTQESLADGSSGDYEVTTPSVNKSDRRQMSYPGYANAHDGYRQSHPMSLSSQQPHVAQSVSKANTTTDGSHSRFERGRMVLETGNTYQQAQPSSPSGAEIDDALVYDSLNRGLLTKTLSH